jgi:dihydroceramidase
MQLVDELSMIYTISTLLFAVFSFQKSKPVVVVMAVSTVVLAAFITGYYHYLQDPDFHQNAFTIMALVVVSKTIYNMESYLRPKSKGPTTKLTAKERRDLNTLNLMWKMIGCGIGTVGFGFFLWTLDNIFCSTLRQWRHQVGLPWGILLEGHGWW